MSMTTAFFPTAVVAGAIAFAPFATAMRHRETMQTVNRDAQTQSDFQSRVKSYIALRQKLEATVKPLSAKATAEEIDTHQRALAQLVIAARKGAKQGDVFGDMTVLVRRLLGPIFKGPDGAAIRNAILEEPRPLVPTVNARYPDDVPLSTMPPDVLKALPKLDESLEFRFVGRHLILLDVPAHLIVDVVDNAMPS